MKIVRIIASTLLAVPFLFAGFALFHPFPPPAGNSLGEQAARIMMAGGLTKYISFAELVCGIMLLIPKTRFLGAMLLLPLVIGIVCFHYTLWPQNLPMAILILVLNLIALADPQRLRALV